MSGVDHVNTAGIVDADVTGVADNGLSDTNITNDADLNDLSTAHVDDADTNNDDDANVASDADISHARASNIAGDAVTNDETDSNVADEDAMNDLGDVNDASDVSAENGANDSDASDENYWDDYSETEDSLQYLPMERWGELEEYLETYWPRSISALAALQTQRYIEELGLGYGFKVYCPYGVPANGMVALHKKAHLSEIIIQCPNDDTSKLEEALVNTDIIDWENYRNFMPYMPLHVAECLAVVAKEVGFDMKVESTDSNEVFILDKTTPVFEIESLEKGMTFKPLSEKDLQIIDPTVCKDLCGGAWAYFRMVCQAKLTYGLYVNQELVCWILGNEVGSFTRLCAADNHKGKGYEELLLKLFCNMRLEADRYVLAYCHKMDINSCTLYEKLGFKRSHEVKFFSMFKPTK